MRIIVILLTMVQCVMCCSQEHISKEMIELNLKELNNSFEYKHFNNVGGSVCLESAYLLGDKIKFYYAMNLLLGKDISFEFCTKINRFELKQINNWYYQYRDKFSKDVFLKIDNLWNLKFLKSLNSDKYLEQQYLNEVVKFRNYINTLKLEKLK